MTCQLPLSLKHLQRGSNDHFESRRNPASLLSGERVQLLSLAELMENLPSSRAKLKANVCFLCDSFRSAQIG